MKRTKLLLDEPTYEALRRKAYESGSSISQVARDILSRLLLTSTSKKHLSVKDFTLIGAGASRQGELSPVSERHDDALADVIAKEHRGKRHR